MYEKLANLISIAIKRWTAKSPEKYKIATNVATGIGILATLITIIPAVAPAIIFPPWAIAIAAFGVALSAKMTVE